MWKSSLGATIRNTGMTTRHLYEMQVKTANYEAMMQRFQLRKVSDMGIGLSKFEAEHLIMDKESGGVRKRAGHRFSLHRMIRSLARWKKWKEFLHSLGSPITPTSRVATLHGIIMFCTYHFQLFYLPFGRSYYPNGSPGTRAANVAMELIFLINLLLNFNTAYQDKNALVTSRKLIARNYINKWFIVDFLSAIPRCAVQYFVTGSLEENTPLLTESETVLMLLRLLRITLIDRAILLSRVVRISKAMAAWLRYSRFSHLLGIAQLMWLVLLIAHYMACLWHVVSENNTPQEKHILEKYVADYYYAVSLIQGQGNIVGTTDENLFSTAAILVGSVVLAIVFGNVAMLVSNFNASFTNYHRKMEAVFATMDKMGLPDKLRDRIHQYYTHVWTEYESLDGDKMFTINRGICALAYTWDSECGSETDDRDTDVASETSTTRFTNPESFPHTFNRQVRGSAKFKLQTDTKLTSTDNSSSNVRSQQHRLPGDALQPSTPIATNRSEDNYDNTETQLMYPGETTGEMGLIMNHMQAGSIRAVTIDKGQFPFPWEEITGVVLSQRHRRGDLGATLNTMHAAITAAEAAEVLVERLDVELHDKTIKFGLQGADKPLEQQLPPLPGVLSDKTTAIRDQANARTIEAHVPIQASSSATDGHNHDELLELVRVMAGAITRMENDLKLMKDRFDQIPPSTVEASALTTTATTPTVARRDSNSVSHSRQLARVKSLGDREIQLETSPGQLHSACTNINMNSGAVKSTDMFSSRASINDILSPTKSVQKETVGIASCPPLEYRIVTSNSLESKNKTFEETPDIPVLLHPRSRMSVVVPHRLRASRRRASIRQILSTTFLKQVSGSVHPPTGHHSKSCGRSRGPELSLADQLWNRHNTDDKISAEGRSQVGEPVEGVTFPESPLDTEKMADDMPRSRENLDDDFKDACEGEASKPISDRHDSKRESPRDRTA
ncbi:unnamed protein product [Phytophthora fragariaefolia]|uniref:Unnamed protein product n=1 Tax=Phytophthora fragariaefolia TaxID=1490495 RepID=A0A9W7CXE7_9STRA|nr:unnamed protein product [Phytophthora fragariaefolia]